MVFVIQETIFGNGGVERCCPIMVVRSRFLLTKVFQQCVIDRLSLEDSDTFISKCHAALKNKLENKSSSSTTVDNVPSVLTFNFDLTNFSNQYVLRFENPQNTVLQLLYVNKWDAAWMWQSSKFKQSIDIVREFTIYDVSEHYDSSLNKLPKSVIKNINDDSSSSSSSLVKISKSSAGILFNSIPTKQFNLNSNCQDDAVVRNQNKVNEELTSLFLKKKLL